MLNFNGYQVEPGAIINTFVSSFDDSSGIAGSGTGFEMNYEELSLTCSMLNNSDDNAKWMVISSSSNANYTIVNDSLSNLVVRISEGEVIVACVSEEYNESINVTITTGGHL